MTTGSTRVIPMRAEHATAVLTIYQSGIDTGDATFENRAPDWATFDSDHLDDHRFVAVDAADRVVGWVAAVPVSSRCVYAGVIEHSVYVDPTAQGAGIGRLLLDALIDSADRAGIWTIQSGIFPENTASLALHRRAGFRGVGVRERIGRRDGRWRDVHLIERRSAVVGVGPSGGVPAVLFVCVKNAGKSQMAAGLMRARAGDRLEVHSAGTRPGSALNEQSVQALLDVGIDISGELPKGIDRDLLSRMDVVVTLGREARLDEVPGPEYENWDTDEPTRRGIEGAERMRLIRDDIAARVAALHTRLSTE